MAELLIQAKGHWMDNFSQAQIDALSESERKSRETRIQLGDIVIIKPDGWNWGNEECLPNYIIVKLPQIDVETVKYLRQSLYDLTDEDNPVLIKKRKWRVPDAYMQQALLNGDSFITIMLSNQQLGFINNLTEKTL